MKECRDHPSGSIRVFLKKSTAATASSVLLPRRSMGGYPFTPAWREGDVAQVVLTAHSNLVPGGVIRHR